MTVQTAGRRQRGFTLLEMMIVIALLSIFAVMVVPPVVNALTLVNRESAILRMDRDGHQALNLISTNLRPSVLPIVTRDQSEFTPQSKINSWAKTDDTISFQDVLNSAVGFSQYGEAWLRVLQNGTDFLPFTQPVPFKYASDDDVTLSEDREKTSLSTLDSNDLLQLGIRDFTYRRADGQLGAITVAGNYEVTPEKLANGATVPRRYLRADGVFQSIHPYLQRLAPQSLGLDPAGLPDTIDLSNARFAEELALPNGAAAAYGIIRFVPYRDGPNSGVRVLDESTLGRLSNGTTTGLDIDGNGSSSDTFALGRLEIIYLSHDRAEAESKVVSRTAATSTVLLRLNTVSIPDVTEDDDDDDDKEPEPYPAIFRLRTPRASDGNRIPSYAVDIDLLLMDDLRQKRSVLSFNQIVPFIVRRYQTTVELRNLTRQ
ncbi:MAG: type II secretion system GspH family protein [Planctomycetes bacterium]|nr:type II secretion system GspH family protein [Planctomycetota bacterium]